MIGEYSVLDLVTLGSVVASGATILGVLVGISRDNQAIKREFEVMSERVESLSKKNSELLRMLIDKQSTLLLANHKELSEGDNAIKSDTGYIRDEMLAEKMARLNLYNSISNADEVLKKLDFMRELVIQNGQLAAQVKVLEDEKCVADLAREQEMFAAASVIKRFNNQLAGFEGHPESGEVRAVLKKLLEELSEN